MIKPVIKPKFDSAAIMVSHEYLKAEPTIMSKTEMIFVSNLF